MPVGQRYEIEPIAPVEEATTRVPAGPVTIGLELRRLDADIVGGFYQGRPDEESVRAEVARRGIAVDGGTSIHVFGSDDGREYLRFDCFDETPHYHYVLPDEVYQIVNEIDVAALGDPFEWTIATLRGRLDPMLREGGASELADRLDHEALALALDAVVALAKATPGDADTTPHAVVARHMEAMLDGDLARVMLAFDDRSVIRAGDSKFVGAAAIRQHFAELLAASPPGRVVTYDVDTESDGRATLRWRLRLSADGEIVMSGADHFTVRDGIVVGQDVVHDASPA